MSTLTSSSSLSDIQASYDNNASYFEDNSVAKARAFCTACRFLLRRMARRASTGGGTGESVEMDPSLIQGELQSAQDWLVANDSSRSGPRFIHNSFEGFRD